MSSKLFLQSLQSKLKGGNSRSIHLNALPGRFATRLDVKQLDLIDNNISNNFLTTLLTKPSFDFKISFDQIDLNEVSAETQKKLSVIAKRLNSIIIENEDYYKEHGIKTLGFGYPILIKRSTKDPTKIIKAPLFIWPLEAVKSKNKVNEWLFLRNKAIQRDGKLFDVDIHSVSINEVLLSFVKGEDNIVLSNLTNEALEDSLIDKVELIDACAEVLHSLNPGNKSEYLNILNDNFKSSVNALPDAAQIDEIANNKAYIHFGGIFGLFRAQKESIITDINRLLDRFNEFKFDNLVVENLSTTPFSAVSTDPSQQAIINSLGTEVNQIIQGPPGTGKSQSLTALIINALDNGLKCLVVCEKKTALDVIKRNIEKTNSQIGTLVGVIDDVNDDREAIVDSVRDRQNDLSLNLSSKLPKSQYNNLKAVLKESAALINKQHRALTKPVYGDKRWSQIVGRYLKLQSQFKEIPLRNVLNKDDFSFHKDSNEMDQLLTIIKQSNNLFNRSKQVHKIFQPFTNLLFETQTVGEARASIEQFISFAGTQISTLETNIQQLQNTSKRWTDEFLELIPEVIKKEIEPYLPFIAGTILTNAKLPESFIPEKQIESLLSTLETLNSEAKKIQQIYQEGLYRQYDDYYKQLDSVLSNYLSFTADGIMQHGDILLDNSRISRAKTYMLRFFSSKHKQIKQKRTEIKTRIIEVKQIHLQKDYINHQYNDQINSTDLAIYLNNIKNLHQKTTLWAKEYPKTINDFLANINEEHFHTDFTELKQNTTSILHQFKTIEKDIFPNYNIITPNNVTNINTLLNVISYLTDQVKNNCQHFKFFRDYIQQRSSAYKKIELTFSTIEHNNNKGRIHNQLTKTYNSLEDSLNLCKVIKEKLVLIKDNLYEFREYHEWMSFYLNLSKPHQALTTTISEQLTNSWAEGFECWYLFWLLSLNEPADLPKNDYELQQYLQQKGTFNTAQLDNIVSRWTEQQTISVRNFKAKGLTINSLFNKKGSKGMRRNSLRKIVKSEFELFTDFFPALLLNPSVCSSILPLDEGIFDLVIFDEASQLRLEDTYAALIRGKAKIVSGDKHQMAPSSYFEGSTALLDPIEEGDEQTEEDEDIDRGALQQTQRNLADSESLLAYAVDKGFKESYLSIHYRSQHPFLIDFSNHAFYGNRLIPIPAKQDYTPIEYLQVDGLYEGQVNKTEALKIVELLQHLMKTNNQSSIGVATFNIYQRNLILEEIGKERQLDPAFDSLMAQMGDSFFVKNLENIQGDERDTIIISTTFGRKANGIFTQNFGPIIQGKGHRMLNVIITRAKQKVYLFTSFPQEYVSKYPSLIQQKGNKGRGILYAYITYAKAVSEQNNDLRNSLLHLLNQYCTDKNYDSSELSLGSESPFEDEVYGRLAHHIGAYRIEQQHKVGGFRIDMIIRHKDTGKPFIALECDGAKYHSSPEAYAWDSFRQEQLERFGFIFYRIWSTKWWDAADRELERLLDFIRKQDISATSFQQEAG